MEAVEKQDTHFPFDVFLPLGYPLCANLMLKAFYTSTFILSQIMFIMSLSNAHNTHSSYISSVSI